jgi:hypothetical protein
MNICGRPAAIPSAADHFADVLFGQFWNRDSAAAPCMEIVQILAGIYGE